ncbi:MAG: hypothetical protein LBH43_17395 [Treponema sp.]|jgi:hypothetical protein|nr:hypothetical protein [Treponema sp.]
MNWKFLSLLFAVLFAVFSCSKPALNEDAPELNLSEEVEYIDPSNYASLGVFVIDGSFSELKDDGKMYWKAGANAGDTAEWTGETKEAVRSYDGATRTFYKVYFNDQELWVQDYYITGPAVPAVIINDEVVLYTKPDLSSVARTGIVTLPKYSIVGMLQNASINGDFIPVAAFLNLAVPGERWVKAKDVTWDPSSVGAVKLARIASITKNPAAHKELLKNAMEMAENGTSFNYIPASVNYNPALFELEITNNIERFDSPVAYMAVLSDKVNKRDLPSADSNVIGTLSEGETFWVTVKTKQVLVLEAPEGETEKPKGIWLGTEEGYWVFSAYAVLNPMY